MNEKANNIQIIDDKSCTGCGTCSALCPNEAIQLNINKKGIYVPELDKRRCDHCGICLKVCPGNDVDFKALNLSIFGHQPKNMLIGNYLNSYVGHAKDYNIRYNSASGGLVTQLLIIALDEGIIDGVLVTRMKKDRPLEPEPFIARTREEIIEASGSKYCPVPVNIGLKEILNSKDGEKFAIVGMPCHIQAIRKAERVNSELREKVILRLGLVCCSCGVNFLGTEYVLKRMNIRKDDVLRIDYRKGAFPPGIMSFGLRNGDIKEISHLDFWKMIFFPFSTWFAPIHCMLCLDQTSELADISVGSAWYPYLTSDNQNQSLVIARSEFGENVLQKGMYKQKIDLIKIDKVDLLKGMIDYKKKNYKANISIFKFFGKKTPSYNINGLSTPKFGTYINGLLIYIQANISMKRYLWSSLTICQLLAHKAHKIFLRIY